MTDGRPPTRATVRRRRRAALAAITTTLLALAGASVAVLSGPGGNRPRYRPPGAIARQLPLTHARLITPSVSTFRPTPAALALAARMPPAAAVAQLFMVRPAAVRGSGWGGVVLTRADRLAPSRVAALVARLDGGAPASGPRPLIAAAQNGGPESALPGLPPRSQPAEAATGDPTVAEDDALAAGRALRRLGVAMTLAPLADVDVPSGALSGELFGEDPVNVGRFTTAAVIGYAQAGEIAAVAHFPGEGAASSDPDSSPATVGGSLAALQARDLVPFAAVAGRAPVVVMSNASYVAFDGVTPASVSASAISLLRNTLHFQGVIMSDDLDAALQPTAETPAGLAVTALRAGEDLLYIGGDPGEAAAAYAGVLSAARRDGSVRALVHEALLRVLTLKARWGLL